MTTHIDEENHIVISDVDARGGVTGHNVRYVLEFGLTGIIAAFAVVAIYLGYDRLQANLSAAFSEGLGGILSALAPYAALVLFGAIAVGLLFSVWNLLSGPSHSESQSFMRGRVIIQFVLIAAIMAMTYASM